MNKLCTLRRPIEVTVRFPATFKKGGSRPNCRLPSVYLEDRDRTHGQEALAQPISVYTRVEGFAMRLQSIA